MSHAHPRLLFWLQRKLARVKPRRHQTRLTISRIVPSRVCETTCISVSHPTGLYLTNDFIVTHNTSLALNSALAAARAGKSVAFFSLEMRRRQLEYRLLASLSGVVLSRILSGYVADAEYAKVSEALTVLDTLPLAITDRGGQRFEDIRLACRRHAQEHPLDLVVIDYVQLMRGSVERRGATRNEELTDISCRLKALTDEFAVPVLLLSQLNRGAENRADPRPKLSDLRESGALEQDADLVLFLHRKNHREGGATTLIVEKQRNGPTGTVMLSLDRDTTTFTDLGEELVLPAPEPDVRTQQRRMFARRAHAR